MTTGLSVRTSGRTVLSVDDQGASIDDSLSCVVEARSMHSNSLRPRTPGHTFFLSDSNIHMNLYTSGGVFMTPITIVGLAMLALGAYVIVGSFRDERKPGLTRLNNLVLQLGIFAFFAGLLSQAIGLMQAFQAIQQIGDVSPALLAGGLYVSLIAPVWGMILLLSGLALYMVARFRLTA